MRSAKPLCDTFLAARDKNYYEQLACPVATSSFIGDQLQSDWQTELETFQLVVSRLGLLDSSAFLMAVLDKAKVLEN